MSPKAMGSILTGAFHMDTLCDGGKVHGVGSDCGLGPTSVGVIGWHNEVG